MTAAHAQDTPRNDTIDMNLVGDMMLLYLTIGSAFGECALSERIGEALRNRDMADLRRLRDYVNQLPPGIKQRIIQGEDHEGANLDELSEADLNDIEVLAMEIRDIA